VPAALLRLGVQPALAWLSGWREAERRQLVAQLAQAYPVAPAVCDVLCEVGPASPPGHALTPLPWLASHPRSPAAERAVARRLDASRLYRLGVSLAGDPMAMADPARGLDLLDAPAWRPRRGEGGGPDVEPHARDVLTSPSSVTPPPVRRSLGPVEPVGREPEPATPVEPLMADGTSADDHVPAPTHPPPSLAPPLALPLAVAVATQPTPPAVSAPAATGVDTSYGGLLFLLNAALQLGLYGDFTQPQHRGLTCSPWRFLLQAGRALCGRGFASDPLAAWLRGRDTAGVALPPMDRLPADWLQPFSSAPGAWQAVFETGRLRLRHPAGFSVVDIPATSEGREALIRAELGRLGAGVPALRRTVRLPRHAQRPRRPHLLWPYLRARLALALGTPARRLAALLRLPARVHDTGSRVDVHIALDALPLTVRLAGLDRDPGWIPAAGCDLRFHFG
jgi:hypothetical protein